jgi:uncharacterized membrane protein YdjX (TVP38/TMEM64 family)
MQIGCPVSLTFLKSPRFWIALTAVAFVVALRMTKLGELLSLDTLRDHRGVLVAWVETNKLLASAGYVLVYVVVVAFSFPGAAILTLAGGFLFGAALGTALTAVGATVGATIVFLFAKFLLGDRAFDRLGTHYPNLVVGIRKNAWSYLLVLRFVPLFPFFLVNLVAACYAGPRRPSCMVRRPPVVRGLPHVHHRRHRAPWVGGDADKLREEMDRRQLRFTPIDWHP